MLETVAFLQAVTFAKVFARCILKESNPLHVSYLDAEGRKVTFFGGESEIFGEFIFIFGPIGQRLGQCH